MLPLEQTIPFCANRVAIQVAKAFARIAVVVVHVFDLEDRYPETVLVLSCLGHNRISGRVFTPTADWEESWRAKLISSALVRPADYLV